MSRISGRVRVRVGPKQHMQKRVGYSHLPCMRVDKKINGTPVKSVVMYSSLHKEVIKQMNTPVLTTAFLFHQKFVWWYKRSWLVESQFKHSPPISSFCITKHIFGEAKIHRWALVCSSVLWFLCREINTYHSLLVFRYREQRWRAESPSKRNYYNMRMHQWYITTLFTGVPLIFLSTRMHGRWEYPTLFYICCFGPTLTLTLPLIRDMLSNQMTGCCDKFYHICSYLTNLWGRFHTFNNYKQSN